MCFPQEKERLKLALFSSLRYRTALAFAAIILLAASAACMAAGKDLPVIKWETANNLEKLSECKWRSTGTDPFLVSAPLGDIPTDGMQFEIRMKITGAPGGAEIRWWAKGEGPDTNRTCGFSPICDGQWHTYNIVPFLQLKDWQRPISIIRIDPTSNSDSEIEIESIKLVPVDLPNVDYKSTVQLDRKLHYSEQPIRFQVYYPRQWTGELPRPMFSYAISDDAGKKIKQGVMLGAPVYNRHYSIIQGLESIEGLPAGRYTLNAELRNDKQPDKPVIGSLSFEVLDPNKRHVLTLPWQYLKDYTVIHADGEFHAFGLIGRADQHQDWMEEGLQNEKQFFHATSPDLVNWTQHADILHCPKTGCDDRGVWAPHVFKYGTQYWMFYTGTQTGVVQRMCAATSPNLFDWTRLPENPLMAADKTDWAAHTDGGWTDYRDPMVFHDEPNNRWIAYNVAGMPNKGAVAAAVSDDLIHWKDAGAVYTGPYIPESPFAWYSEGKYYLSVNAGGRGVYVADSPLGPFTEKLTPDPMPQNVMAYELLQIKPGLWLLSGFAWEVNGNYVEFFEMSMKDGKPVVSTDLSRVIKAVSEK